MVLKWGIIGIGRHSDLRMAPAIRRAKDTSLTAVYSRDRGRAEAFAAKHGAECVYDLIEGLVKNPSIDIVYIASPNSLHAPHTILAAEAGKHVLCEKPMALTPRDCEEMIRVCHRNGVKLGVGFHARHHPAHITGRDIIKSGRIGEIVFSRAQWSSGVRGQLDLRRPPLSEWWEDPAMAGGGAVMATGVHAVDLLRFLLDDEVVEVSAYTDGQITERPLERTAAVILKFRRSHGFVGCSRVIPDPTNDIIVYGVEGRVSGIGTLSTEFKGELEVALEDRMDKTRYLTGDLYLRQVEAFNKSVERDEEPNASGLDGLRVAAITEAVFESSRRGESVKVHYTL